MADLSCPSVTSFTTAASAPATLSLVVTQLLILLICSGGGEATGATRDQYLLLSYDQDQSRDDPVPKRNKDERALPRNKGQLTT